MKKSVFFLAIILLCGKYSKSQDVMKDIAKTYFRSNPFITEFGFFLDHLLHDPTIINKEMKKRTDTSFFYFKGQYTNHNPFPFISLRTEIMLTETTENVPDSIPRLDTFFVYQILAYTLGGKEGLDDVKKEFNRFDKKFGKKFANAEKNDLTQDEEIVGEARNYFYQFFFLSPVTAAWGMIKGKNENVFALTLRMKR